MKSNRLRTSKYQYSYIPSFFPFSPFILNWSKAPLIFPFSFFILNCWSAFAQPPALEKLISHALQHNPSWKSEQLHLGVADAQIEASTSWKDPMIKLTQFGESVETRLGPQERILGFSQKLPFWGESKWAEKSAQASKQMTEHIVEWKKLSLIYEVKKSYYQLWALQQSLELLRKNQTVVKNLTELLENEISTQSKVLRSVLKAQTQLGQITYDTLMVEEKIKEVKARLQYLLGGSFEGNLEKLPTPTFSEVKTSLEEMINQALENNPAWLSWKHQLSKMTYERKQAEQREWMPNVELGFNYIEIGEADNPSMADSGKDAYSFSIGVNLPFGSRNESAILQKRLKEQQTQMERHNQANQLRETVTKLYHQLTSAHRLVQLYEQELLPQAKQSHSVAEIHYRSGAEQASTVLEAEEMVLKLRLNLLKAQQHYLTKLAELSRFAPTKSENKGDSAS